MLDIKKKAEKTLGITFSNEWLTACLAHLRLINEENVEGLFHQVLHSDLRDVVRSSSGTIDLMEADTTKNPPNILLRNAVQQSLRGESRKVTLPSNFRLLVQIEELSDVSLSAETRSKDMPGATNFSNNARNQKLRCLKAYVSDGHLPSIDLVGMEIVPIPKLSVRSEAGLKVLMQGPLDVRLGILEWNPSNLIVLGGCVAELIPIQRKALKEAQRLAGVDPTIRALIGNDPIMDEEQEDEGERASSDVIESPPIPTANALQASTTRRRLQQPLVHIETSIQRLQPRLQSFNQLRPSLNSESNMKETMGVVLSKSNPYTRNSVASSREFQINQESIRRKNIHNATAGAIYDANIQTLKTDNPETPLHKKDGEKVSIEQPSKGFSTHVRLSEPVSFPELIALIHRTSNNRHQFEKIENKIFVVPAKMKGCHKYFNIEKKRKNGKKKVSSGDKDDKYEYVMRAHFTGSGTSQLLTVLVADQILRPHFQLKPGEMRKLSREDRVKSQTLVREGGSSVTAALSVLSSWEVNILFPESPTIPLDGDIPVLKIMRKG